MNSYWARITLLIKHQQCAHNLSVFVVSLVISNISAKPVHFLKKETVDIAQKWGTQMSF